MLASMVVSSNEPEPRLVQITAEEEPLIVPVKVWVEFAQMVSSTPALTTAIALIVKTNESTPAGQGPDGSSVVKVNTTEPAAISAAEGVYTAANKVASSKLPVPDVVQTEETAEPLRVPARV